MSAAGNGAHGCRRIVGGKAHGPVLRSSDGICFYRIEPETGIVREKDHALDGRCVAGTVLVFPTGKGSSVVQLDGLYQLVKHGVAPRAMVVASPDTVLVACAVIMDIPMVSQVEATFDRRVPDGAHVEVDADRGLLTVLADAGSGLENSQ